MAKYDSKPFSFPEMGSFSEGNPFAQQEAALKKLQDFSDGIDFTNPKASLKGAMLRWQRADGYAHYIVTADKPLTVNHVPFGDAWEVEAALIRGLNRAEVIKQLEFAKHLRDLFSKPQEPLT
jgi:hypothetical protein